MLATLGDEPDREAARRAGGAIAAALAKGAVTVCTGGVADRALLAELVCAMVLRLYDFRDYKKAPDEDDDDAPTRRAIAVASDEPEALAAASAPFAALAEGIYFTRDLVNEPANRLTTDEFAARLAAMGELGLEVEIIGEDRLREMGAHALLGVGQGSENETKIVVMKWLGRRRRGAAGARRQGRDLRHRRHLAEARRRHGGHDHGHGRRRRGRRRHADAGAAQGAAPTSSASSGSSRTCPTPARSAPATSSPR